MINNSNKDRKSGAPEELSLTEAQKAELDRRLDAYLLNPEEGSSWEDVRERFYRMPETNRQVIFSRHAKRRMKLYQISEEHILTVLSEGTKDKYDADRFTFVKKIPEFKYPLKVIVQKEDNTCTIITAYPLKRRGANHEGIL